MQLQIRQEEVKDHQVVFDLIEASFKDEPFADNKEHFLVDRLKREATFIKELSLVALVDDHIVGYVLLTPIEIENPTNNKVVGSLALAPVAVLPGYQNKGIGKALILASHARAKSLGYGSVVVLGHEDYYPKLGYRISEQYGIKMPFDVPAPNSMVIELIPGSLKEAQGIVKYPEVFFK